MLDTGAEDQEKRRLIIDLHTMDPDTAVVGMLCLEYLRNRYKLTNHPRNQLRLHEMWHQRRMSFTKRRDITRAVDRIIEVLSLDIDLWSAVVDHLGENDAGVLMVTRDQATAVANLFPNHTIVPRENAWIVMGY